MISKQHFLSQMTKLMTIFDEQLDKDRLMAYYEVLSPDFTDAQFDEALNHALKTSFKFPLVAAFYKREKNEYDAMAEALRGCR